MFVSVLPTCTSMYHMHALCSQRPEEGDRLSGTGVTDGCELPRGCWEQNPGHLQEQPVPLTWGDLLSPQLPVFNAETD